MPLDSRQVVHGLLQAISPVRDQSVLPPLASAKDRVIMMVDSSEVASAFTIGVFVTTINAGNDWFQRRFKPWNAARSRPGEGLSYKAVGSRDKDVESLREFLSVADECPGLLIGIHTPRITQLVLSAPTDTKTHPELVDFRTWSKKDFERLLRTGVAVAVASAVSRYSQAEKILVHDTDQLFASEERSHAAQSWISGLINASFDLDDRPLLGLMTKEKIHDPLVAKAMFGVADLGAGGVGSYLTQSAQEFGIAEGLYVPAPRSLNAKDQTLLNWFADPPRSLNKAVLSYGFADDRCHVHEIGLQ